MLLLDSLSRFRRRSTRTALLLCLTVGSALLVSVFTHEPPDKLLNRARRSTGDDRVTLLVQAIETSGGKFPQAQLELCLALARDKKKKPLITAFSALPLQECDPSELMLLATLSTRAEQWAIADDCFLAVSHRPHDVSERLSLQCELYVQSSRTPELIQAATELTGLAPDSPVGWWFLAKAHEKRQNNMDALAVYRDALTHRLPAKDQFEMRHRMLEHAIETGDVETAKEQRDLIAASSGTDIRLYIHDARLLHLQGYPAEALGSINEAIKRIGKIPEALRLRGILYLELNELEKAIADLKEAAAVNPQDEVTFFKLAEAYRRLAARDESPEHLRTAEVFLSEYQRLHSLSLQRLGLQK